MNIEDDCISFCGHGNFDNIYLVIRNSGIEISDKKIESILPVYELKLKNNKVKNRELTNILKDAGCCTENEFIFNGETYSCLTEKRT